MTPLIADKLRDLSAVLADLRDRVRAALATELARVIAGAVRDVLAAVLAGERVTPTVHHPAGPSRRRPTEDDPDPWDDDPDGDPEGPALGYVPARHGRVVPVAAGAPGAVAAGAAVARWWVARGGSRLAAAGVGLAVAVAGLTGGPAARALAAVLAAAADLFAAADALGAGAARLAHP